MVINKTLFLSFCMPPLKYPRSIQISRLLKNMPIKPSVIYADEEGNIDETIMPDMKEYVNSLIQIPYTPDNRYLSFFKRKVFPLVYNSPDLNRNWSNKLYKKAYDYLKENKKDTIVTFGQPMSVHLAGLKLKLDFPEIKWIAHFSDPWVDNPLNKKGFFTKKYNEYLENRVFSFADKLIFTSNETIELVSKRYNKDISNKFEYLPHAYDESFYDYKIKNEKEELIISYIGGFYSQRTPKPLFEAVKRISLENPSVLKNVKFKIVGNLGRHSGLKSNYKEILKYFEFLESVSYQKSLNLMLKSDILLVIDAPAEKSVFFPSKLVDYIGSNKPIIGITPDGTSSNVITELGGDVASPSNINEIVSMLTNVLANRITYKCFQANESYLAYKSDNITKSFCNIIYK